MRKLSLTYLQVAIIQLLVLVHEGCEDLLLLGRVHLVKTLRDCWVGVVLQLVRLFGEWLGGRWLRGLVARLRGPGTLRLCMVELGLDKGCCRSCRVG